MDEGQEFRYAPASESGKLTKQMGKSAVQVSGDYLAGLVTHAREMLRRRFGAARQTFDLHYILTVPRSAHLAEIPAANLTLLSEPEAAAVYAIRTIQPNTIAEGDCLIVCDAGGGTVDIITYRVKQTEPLIFEEATEGTGAVCGSVMLDERFDDLVKTIIEQKSAKGLPPVSARAARRYWQDYIKPKYAGPVGQDEFDDPGYWVSIPGVSGIREVDLSEGHLYLEKYTTFLTNSTMDQVKEIFDPIVQQIKELVAEQRRNIKEIGLFTKAIILVGGLGASEYLFKCLEVSSDGIQIMQPPNAWSAVVRGAVYRGREGNQVEGRISRCNYGTEIRVLFDPKIHGAEFTPRLCGIEEEWYMHGQMRWYIKKGQSVAEGDPIRMELARVFGLNESLVWHETLRFCLMATAPGIVNANMYPFPQLITRVKLISQGVAVLCRLEADLSRVPRELFQKHTNSKGVDYYRICFDLVLTPTSASLLFDLQFNGVSYGSVRSRY
ncbi:hypothetical protein N7499_010276 [Penicillium canescens]|uniref:Actin-like ATPase domain-containing protein n=1 Tax=Penicillium canescens TaxID=5083 RepID=A0AAD6NBL2_PENCN|nr:uncharacterized protein N7446_005428 [Penicillium canescens]KAJ6050332.1 hypothetical protein N7444_007048 [Penicillium canescens]KAJ6050804.1 hypothetical protein N7460_001338 [Penicillium canescens]KAJ6061308.1 hypothetical protein N7446_005428 [Penicillium canescens]KAJ6068389.1 hypothetical protein N7499_010276 [Penicillium canescens]KAJ6183554.1 hypothetical protein N7485_002196 [Penicillium canescens]